MNIFYLEPKLKNYWTCGESNSYNNQHKKTTLVNSISVSGCIINFI